MTTPKNFSDRQAQVEPNKNKRTLLLGAPVKTPTEGLAMSSLFTQNSGLWYNHVMNQPLNFPIDNMRHYSFLQDWYFVVGQLSMLPPTGGNIESQVPPTGGNIESQVPPTGGNIDFAFVLILQSSNFMGSRLLQSGETAQETNVETTTMTVTSIAEQNTVSAKSTTIWATEAISTMRPFSFQCTKNYTLTSSNPNGDLFPMKVYANDSATEVGVNVTCVAKKNILLQGSEGFVGIPNIGEGWGYYSFPVLAMTGTLTYRGTLYNVSGQGWFDHQWGTTGQTTNGLVRFFSDLSSVFKRPKDFAGWNWFSIQLDNNVQFTGAYGNVYATPGGPPQVSLTNTAFYGNLFPADDPSYLIGGIITIDLKKFTRSPKTNVRYPIEWIISVPSEELEITLSVRSPNQFGYFATGVEFAENACTASGTYRGKTVTGMGWGENVGFQNENAVRRLWLQSAGLSSNNTSVATIVNADYESAKSSGGMNLFILLSAVIVVLLIVIVLVIFVVKNI